MGGAGSYESYRSYELMARAKAAGREGDRVRTQSWFFWEEFLTTNFTNGHE
jgi:hypothetical protein